MQALVNFSVVLTPGEILGLIGPNGAGKTTLFNVITGFMLPECGNVYYKKRELIGLSPHTISRLGIARTFQNLRLIRRLSVLENILLFFPDQPGEHLVNLFCRWRTICNAEKAIREKALTLLESVGLAEKAYDQADDLSYGQQKLLSHVCCLATGAELLLLDEPVAGIAPEMMEKILHILSRFPEHGKSVILIEHNFEAVAQVCHRVIFMDAGINICEGTPDEIRNDPRVIKAYLD